MLYSRDGSPYSHPDTPVLPGNVMYMNFPSSETGPSNCNASQNELLLNFGNSEDFSAWKGARNETLMMQSLEGGSGVLDGAANQGLSLSLSTHVPSTMQILSMQHTYANPNFSSILGSNPSTSGEDRGRNMSVQEEDNFQMKQMRDSDYMPSDGMKHDISSYGMPSIARAVPNSKYLKVAQQLLDEVVNVKKAMKKQNAKNEGKKDGKEVDGKLGDGGSDPCAGNGGESAVPQDSSKNSPNEISAAEKQEFQNKMAKLLSMLDEVDRRYRQYYHQMQIVVSSFDTIAGSGAAKPYTALALQTISRHFRCLRDAINAQIQVARKNLGEEDDSSNDKGVGISRLRYVDQQLRQQRALQQLGMIQQHTWRPQRGLPETSVSILRAWLFEHFLHPYPKDSDKIMLARQTGLTRSQVSNWFINARVRLWKPMVEEMYKEEAGDVDMDSNSSSEAAPRSSLNTTHTESSKDKGDNLQQSVSSSGQIFEPKPDQVPDIEMLGSDTNSTFQNLLSAVPETDYGILQKHTNESSHLFPGPSNFGSHRFMYMPELERFSKGSGVSLTLGLQQCEGSNVAMSDSGFVPMRGNEVCNAGVPDLGSTNAEFDCMDSGNQTHRFVSSLLPSFT